MKKKKNNKVLPIIGIVLAMLMAALLVVIINADKIGVAVAKRQTGREVVAEENTEDKEFLEDENFLDEYQPNAKTDDDKDKPMEVTLVTSSVQEDMRVIVVGDDGKPVAGEEFYVVVRNLGEYKDLDKDGVIYIAGIKAGTYDVELKNTDKYVCKDTVSVDVSEKIKYEVMEDISYLIKTEDQIKKEEADVRKKRQDEHVEDGTDEISTELITDLTEAEPGIDVSKWNAEIDWEKVADAGVKFAIIRVGYRGWYGGELVEDPMFRQNIEGARKAGIKVGMYFFSQAIDEYEAIEEASMCMSILEEMEIDSIEYPIFIDSEWSTAENGRADLIDVDTRTAVVDAFCKTIEKAGMSAGIYASRTWYYDFLNDDQLMGHVRWVAEYRDKPLYTGIYQMWQYSSIGQIDGIEGDVDMNLSYLYPNETEEDEE